MNWVYMLTNGGVHMGIKIPLPLSPLSVNIASLQEMFIISSVKHASEYNTRDL